MEFSKFTSRFSSHAGIVQLMEDLGAALSGDQNVLMLGGGNPSHIPQVQQIFHERLERILADPAEFAHVIGDYDSPQGEQKFIASLARLLRSELEWNIGPENIVLTAGSQAGFFYLFNMFAGEFSDGVNKQIMLPLIPEYIGYTDVGLVDNLFVSCRPEIEIIDDHIFKYRVNFRELKVGGNIGALCVSRPTNPTGNVLTDDEIRHLLEIASNRNIPLIIDNAYGLPFPDIIFTGANPVWTENTILCLSLSKLGLPGTRTGIIIASEEIVKVITNMNAVLNLALGSFGPALVLDMVKSGEITRISQTIIKPYYQNKVEHAVRLVHKEFNGINYYIHKPEGAIFLWLWFPGLPISSEELYQRLKKRGVLVISGHHFFPGFEEDWEHKHECIRVTYSMETRVVEEGIKIIAEEVRKVS
ncbi:MAG: valine--pyruvate transaminase [Gammaproteobacteria bacterium RIFCSPLOWO2_12_FULL_47_76]|nr:MAG: valine--pyruvate transaminase [Gammaproteobacteria bacterium RIFCSPLOWO2_12_FULL_47_76]